MLAVYKKNEIVVDVKPFYLHGRIVAYVGKLYIGIGNVVQEKYAYLPDELDFENVKQ